MNAREFAFWLQGAYEVGGENFVISNVIADKINVQLKRVSTENMGVDLAEFIGYVTAKLEDFNTLTSQDARLNVSNAIGQKLNDVFVHAIDPTIKGDQKNLRNLHGGINQKKDNGVVAMC